MPVYYLLEYSKYYRKTTGGFWNYYRDESSNPLSSNSESFKYKTKNIRQVKLVNDANKVGKNETEVVIPLK